jgi:hypothetical protein
MEGLSLGAIEAGGLRRLPDPKCAHFAKLQASRTKLFCMRDTVGCGPMAGQRGRWGWRGKEDGEHWTEVGQIFEKRSKLQYKILEGKAQGPGCKVQWPKIKVQLPQVPGSQMLKMDHASISRALVTRWGEPRQNVAST